MPSAEFYAANNNNNKKKNIMPTTTTTTTCSSNNNNKSNIIIKKEGINNFHQQLNISTSDIETLVFEINENLRLSTSSSTGSGPNNNNNNNTIKIKNKSIPCSHLSRKSSRASPYRLPGKYFCNSCNDNGNNYCIRHNKSILNNNNNKHNHHHQEYQDDPYEVLQQLLKSENLINEAVRRVKMNSKINKNLFYDESDEESSTIGHHQFHFFTEKSFSNI